MATTIPRNYWMVAVRPEYYDKCVEQKFTLLGMGRSQRKRVQRMEVGDRVLFYVTVRMVMGAVTTVASTYFEDDTPTWPPLEPGDNLAWRVKIKPDVVLDDNHLVDARLIAPRMQYVKKWAPEQWPLAFQGLLHLIPKQDFALIEDEMRKGVGRPEVTLGDDDGSCILGEMAAKA
jgi:hypothetical protein